MDNKEKQELIEAQAKAFKQALSQHTREKRDRRVKTVIVYPVIGLLAFAFWFEIFVMKPLEKSQKEKQNSTQDSSYIFGK